MAHYTPQNDVTSACRDETSQAATCLEAGRLTFISREAEQQLARQIRDTGDLAATSTLIACHQSLAAIIARRYRGYNVPLSVLLSEADRGLMQAVLNFDPRQSPRLATYALWWIKAILNAYILNAQPAVTHEPGARKKLADSQARLETILAAYEAGDDAACREAGLTAPESGRTVLRAGDRHAAA